MMGTPEGSAVALAALTGLGAAAAWGFGCLLFDSVQRRLGDDAPAPAGLNLFKNGLALIVFGLTVLAIGGSFPGPDSFWPLFWSGVVGFAIGDSLYLAAFPLAGVQVTAMVGNLTPPIAGLVGWAFFGESFGMRSLLWMAVVMAGVSLVILDPQKKTQRAGQAAPKNLALGLLLALGAAVSQAVAIVVAHSSFEGVEVVPGTVVRLFGGLVAGLGIASLVSLLPGGRRSSAGLAATLRPLGKPALMGVLLVPTFFATLVALPLHSATVQVAPGHLSALLLSTSPLFILPLGLKFGVRQGPVSIFGTLVGFLGVAGLIWMG